MILKHMKDNTPHISYQSWYLLCILGCILLLGTGPVQAAAELPEVLSLTPDAGYAGFSFLVTLTGNNFSDGQTVGLSLDDSSLTISNQTFLSNSSMTFRVVIPADAKPGLYQMSLTSPDGVTQRFNQVFHVQPPAAPEIENLTPSLSMAGTLVEVNLTGKYFRSGGTVTIFRGDQQVNLTNQSVSYDRISGTFLLPVDAIPGHWNATVMNPDGQGDTITEVFTITQLPSPQIIGITPDQGDMDKPVLVAVTGSNFLPGARFSLSRKDRTFNPTDLKFDSPGRILGTVEIPHKYLDGLWDLTVTNPDGQIAQKSNAYLSGEPYAPFNMQISPAWGVQGSERMVTIRGMAFLEGDMITLQKGDIIIPAKNISVISDTQVTCTIHIASDAEPGTYDVVATSRYNKSDLLKNGFTIYKSDSHILAGIEPDAGEQGQYLTATVIGHNLQNGSVISLTTEGEEPITGEIRDVSRPDEMAVWLHIPSDAMPDIWDLTLISPSGQEITKKDAFRIYYNKTPMITAIDPDRTVVGTDDLKITVTGSNFGDGEYINLNLTLNNTTLPIAGAVSYKGTLITGYLSIPNGTETGWYNLSVSRDAGLGKTATKPEMFRVI